MQVSKIGIISNIASTRMVREMDALRAELAEHPQIIHRELTDIAEMTLLLRAFSDEGVDLIILNGGDGTVQAAVTSLINDHCYESLPALSILPGGRTNMTAESIGIHGSPIELIRRWAYGERPDLAAVSLPFVRFQLTPDAEPILGTFFGAAAVVRGIHACRRRLHPLNLPNGLTHTLAISSLVMASLNPFKTEKSPMRKEFLDVQVDEESHEQRPYFVVAVTSLPRLLLGLGRRLGKDEGSLKYISVDYGGLSLVRAIVAMMTGTDKIGDHGHLHQRLAEEVHVTCEGEVTLDGEMFTPTPGVPITLGLSPAMTFLLPPD